jgi:phosphoglycerol transferase MdoB-like AlkP superfamily enzyme
MKNIKQFVVEHFWIIMLMALKTMFFYFMIDLSPIGGLIGIITVFFLVAIFFSCFVSSNKYSSIIFAITYTLLTLWMFADTIYFSYFNQLTSINQLWQMNSLVVVDESVKFATPPISILLFLDIPIVIRYFKKEKAKFKTINVQSLILGKSSVVFMSMLFLMVVLAINPVKANSIQRVNHTEFFTYHVKDILGKVIEQVSFDSRPIDEVIAAIEDYREIVEEDSEIEDNEIEEIKEIKEEKKADISQDGEINRDLTGIAKGKNLIVIQLESIQNFVINAEYNGQIITPNLNQLIQDNSLYFDRYFQTIGKGNTADAEFSSHNSIYPVIVGESYRLYEQNTFYGLPWLFKNEGYKTMVYHGYKGDFWNRNLAYPNQGIDQFISLDDLEETEKIAFGLSDKELFRQTLDYLEEEKEPFYSLIVTLSSHHPYSLPEIYDEITLKEEDIDTVFGNYIRSVHYVDEALGQFIQELKESGLYDNTVIALYGDHQGLNSKDAANYKQMSDFLGYAYDYDQMLRIPLIIHIPDMEESRLIHTVGGQVDFMPTMANLFGMEIEHPFVFGRDIVNAETGFVASLTYMLKGSFIKDDIIFEFSRDGLFENSRAWHLDTREPIALDGLEDDHLRAISLIEESKNVLDNNLIETYFEQIKN